MSNLETVNTEIDSHKVFWEQERKQKKDRKRILSLIPNISDAIQAMVDGIEDAINYRDCFRFDMETFGYAEELEGGPYFCYGCAATVAIEKIFNQLYDEDNIYPLENRANYMDISIYVLDRIEKMFHDLCNDVNFYQLDYLYDRYTIDDVVELLRSHIPGFDDYNNPNFRNLSITEYDGYSDIENKLENWQKIIEILRSKGF